jgi:mannose-1-phosphate guanylyltransferase/mannose-1-phosphate guanylyltransferase/mannose-6-phosphate isomerase
MFDDILILAGGSGTRLWPLSNSKKPKQFLDAGNSISFFEMALLRADACLQNGLANNIIIAAGISHIPHIKNILSKNIYKKINEKCVIIAEPCAKNTAAAIACVVNFIAKKNQQSRVLVITSDHIISPLEIFVKDADALSGEIENGGLGVFGITPESPATGYGYIETSVCIKGAFYKTVKFHEKPNAETAVKYIKSGNYFWNSGMFAFSVSFMLHEFNTHAKDIIEPFLKMTDPLSQNELKKVYEKLPSISFDYAIAEKCNDVKLIKTSFNWKDVGSWDEYCKLVSQDDVCEKIFSFQSNNNSIFSDIPVALCDVDDLLIVIKVGKDGPVALIAKKNKTQDVAKIVAMIKNEGRGDLL